MDIELFKKMDVYPSDVTSETITKTAKSESSTLIKPDISRFHEPSLEIEVETVEDSTPLVPDYDEGFKQGQEQSNANYQQEIAVHQDTIKVMQAALDLLQTERASVVREIEANYLSAIGACMRAVFPALMRGGTDLELQAVLKLACGSALKGQVHLMVHPDDESHCEKFSRDQDILVSTDDALKPLQMRLQWSGGGADIDCLSVASRCLESLSAVELENSRDL
ncbi:MAG: hypothetical protein ABJ275_02300 [Maricaulaceae bacterium]